MIDPGPTRRVAAMCRQRAEYPQRMSLLATGRTPDALRAVSEVLAHVAEEIERAVDEGAELVWDKAQLVRLPEHGAPLRVIERHAILEALAMSGGVQKGAARLLHVTPRVLNYRMQALGILRPKDSKPPERVSIGRSAVHLSETR